jgi:eukaryotic-like serine/threonine-protein kinase
MQRIKSIIHEVHRRSLWQVLGIYLVGSWIGYEVINGLTQGLGLPDWVPAFAVVLFIIGLPIVLATAFVQEGPPQVVPSRATGDPAATPLAEDAIGPVEPPSTAGAAARAPPPDSDPWLTWRRSIAAGVTAFLLLGLTAGGYMGMRNAGIGPFGSLVAAGTVGEQERILIADFSATGNDTALADIVTEAFRIDFARSAVIRAVEPAAVRDALRRMDRADAARLNEELAFEIARRDGVNVVITGDVARSSGGHVLSARLIGTESGEVLGAARESARTDDDLLPAIDRLSRVLRERIGESLRTIRRTEPLAQVTTPSLAALERYTRSLRATGWEGDPDRGFALLQEAVALDSTFAAAHYGLGIHYSNRYQYERAMHALDTALRNEDRLTEAQRYIARSTRHSIRREYPQAAAELERLIEIQPDQFAPLNNLALIYSGMGDHARADQYYRRAIATDTSRFFGWANLAENLFKQGQLEEGLEAYEQAIARAPESGWPIVGSATVLAAFGRHREAETALRTIIDDDNMARGTQAWATQNLIGVLGAMGRYRESVRMTEQLVTTMESPEAARVGAASRRLLVDAYALERVDRARSAIPAHIRMLEDVAPTDTMAWLTLATACGWIGEVGCARDALARPGLDGPPAPWASIDVLIAHAMVAVAEDDPRQALRTLRSIRDRACQWCEEPLAGRIFERMGEPDSAIAAYERFLSTTQKDRFWVDDMDLGPMLRSLGQLYEQRGDSETARRHYARLVELWENADPELEPVVADVRGRLARLQPDR